MEEGSIPRLTNRRAVSVAERPQSIRIRSDPASTKVEFALLPLESTENLMGSTVRFIVRRSKALPRARLFEAADAAGEAI
jgi:hypothetical protein